MKMKGKREETINAYIFILPLVVLLFFLNFYVFFSGALLSFTDAQGINKGSFIGVKNYIEVITKYDFWLSVKQTFLFVIGCIITQVPVAFLLAYILDNIPDRLKGTFRSAFFVPVLINTIVAALLFRMLFNKDQGVINWVLGLFHLPNRMDWIQDSSLVIPILIIVAFWQWTGFHMVYLLANLQTINKSLYEAAKLDGASHFRVMTQIVLPLMRPAFTFVVVTSAVGCLQMFDLVFMLFPNAMYGPGGVAKTMVAYIYDQAFSQQFRLGYASAVGWAVFFIILAVSLLQMRFLGLGNQEE